MIATVTIAWIVVSLVLAFGLGRLLGGPLPRGRRFADRRRIDAERLRDDRRPVAA